MSQIMSTESENIRKNPVDENEMKIKKNVNDFCNVPLKEIF